MDFTSWNPKELYHFGTKGMRWGQRRFQNPDGSLTPLGMQRYGNGGTRGTIGRSMDLNKLDREYSQASAKAKLHRDKAEHRYSRKNYRFQKHNPGAGNLVKDDKQKKLEKKAAAYEKLANRSKQMRDRIIRNSLNKGMSVRSKDTLRSVNIGRDIAKSAIGSALLPGTYVTSRTAVGTHYRVRNDGNAQRIRKNSKYVRRRAGRSTLMIV